MTNDEWYERERAAFIAWWESEGQAKFGATPTLAAGAGWLAKAEAVRPEEMRTMPLAPYMALGVLLNHIEPGWENCRAALRQWYDSLPRPHVESSSQPQRERTPE